MPKFNARLKKAMAMRGLKQCDICKRTGISKSAMSQYISGSFIPRYPRLHILAEVLDVTEAWLMGFSDTM